MFYICYSAIPCVYIVHGSNVVDNAAYMQLGAGPDTQKTICRNISCPVKFVLVWFDLFNGTHPISLLQSLRKITVCFILNFWLNYWLS